jgi:SAM-dependent methyltransferase
VVFNLVSGLISIGSDICPVRAESKDVTLVGLDSNRKSASEDGCLQMHPLTVARVDACPICHGPTTNSRVFAVVNGWRYVECQACALIFLDPRPTLQTLRAYYNGMYDYSQQMYRESVERQHGWLLGLIETYCRPPGRLLEVGCSYGYFLAAARRRGWSVEGIELNDRAASFARDQLGVPVVGQTLPDAREKLTVSYDAIVAWHVIEHLTDPREFLEHIWAVLRGGGILLLRTPNINSAVARFAGTEWEWLTPPDHVHLFCIQSLSSLLRFTGFKVLLAQTARGNASNIWFEIMRSWAKLVMFPASPAESPGFTAYPKRFANRPWYRAIRRAIESGSKPLDLLVSPCLARFGKEAELLVVAKKMPDEVLAEPENKLRNSSSQTALGTGDCGRYKLRQNSSHL